MFEVCGCVTTESVARRQIAHVFMRLWCVHVCVGGAGCTCSWSVLGGNWIGHIRGCSSDKSGRGLNGVDGGKTQKISGLGPMLSIRL